MPATQNEREWHCYCSFPSYRMIAGRVHSNTILIVDDDLGIREALKMTLEYLGYEVWLAESGLVAFRILKEKGIPFLILLDIMMPQMNGWEFLDGIRKNEAYQNIPIVVITAFHPQVQNHPKPVEILRKPIDIDQMITVLDKYRPKTQVQNSN